MNRWLLVVALLFIAAPALAQTLASPCPGVTRNVQAYAHETLSVGASPVSFTSGTYAPAGKAPTMAVITLETQNIRVWTDGTAPSATVGQLIQTGSFYICGQSNVQNTQMIATTGTAKVSVVYYQ
jgi:ribosomal protein S16